MSHKLYQNFIGIDIGKYEVVAAVHGSKQTYLFKNTQEGWKALHKTLKKQFKDSLVVLEPTGGHELGLLLFLQKLKIRVHRANTKQVKNFIRSFGTLAKNDSLDALALAHYAFERQAHLKPFQSDKEAFKLYELAQRRSDLIKMLVQEKNRLKAPQENEFVKDSCRKVIFLLEEQIKAADNQLQSLIDHNPNLKQRYEILKTIEGIGPVVARNLICYMPELGTLSQKQVASLAGVAPHANESGLFKGQRRIKGGRIQVRMVLFMAAMAARKSNSRFQTFYNQLIARGKKPIVAITALMRKLIVIANAKLKEIIDQKLIVET